MNFIERLNSMKIVAIGALVALLVMQAKPAAAYPQVVMGTITQQVSGATQTAESAIVAVKSGAIYAPNSDDVPGGTLQGAKVIGHFTAGQTLCMANSSTGPNGTIDLSFDNPGIPTDAVVANDGSFIPAPVAGNCEAVATEVDLDAQQAINWSHIDSATGPIAALIFSALAGLLVAWILWPVPMGRLERLLTKEEAAKLFLGFGAMGGEVGYKNGSLHRANSSGTLINLSGWNFDDMTGEFYREVGRQGNNVILSRVSHNERFNGYYRFVTRIRATFWACALVGSGLGIYALNWWPVSGSGIPADYIAVGAIIFMLGVPGVFLLPLAAWPKTGIEAKQAGPEPLNRVYDNFGPSSATAPADHPAQDDLGYKPTT
jgi:hypothetical protein